MLNFCFLILTILEICLTVFLVSKLIKLEKYVNNIHLKLILISTEILMINDKIKETIKKINKVLRFITNKKIYQAIGFLKIVFNTVQIILLIRSFDFKDGKFLNYKNIKRFFLSEIIRKIIRKLILTTANLV